MYKINLYVSLYILVVLQLLLFWPVCRFIYICIQFYKDITIQGVVVQKVIFNILDFKIWFWNEPEM